MRICIPKPCLRLSKRQQAISFDEDRHIMRDMFSQALLTAEHAAAGVPFENLCAFCATHVCDFGET